MESMRGGGRFGWKVYKEFSLFHVEFQASMGHPSRNAGQTVRDPGLDDRVEFWSGDIQYSWVSTYRGY